MAQPPGQFCRSHEVFPGDPGLGDAQAEMTLEVKKQLHHGQRVKTKGEKVAVRQNRFFAAKNIVLEEQTDDGVGRDGRHSAPR